jgi:hypothetical protein
MISTTTEKVSHIPPGIETSERVVVWPTQTVVVPEIGPGVGFTITGMITKHPEEIV